MSRNAARSRDGQPAGAQFLITPAANLRVGLQQKEPARDGVEQSVRDIRAAALRDGVIPGSLEIGFGLREAVRHQRDAERASVKRLRPPCLAT